MSDSAAVPRRTDERDVLAEMSDMINEVLEDVGGAAIEIGMDTRFLTDLELESIDLVALSVRIQERYGERVNFAEFIAGLDLDEIIELRVGQLVAFITRSLGTTGEIGDTGES